MRITRNALPAALLGKSGRTKKADATIRRGARCVAYGLFGFAGQKAKQTTADMKKNGDHNMIEFFVSGTPIPQGSKAAMVLTRRNADIDEAIERLRRTTTEGGYLADRLAAVGRWPIREHNRWMVNTIDDNQKKLKPWRARIAVAAEKAYLGTPYPGPVGVKVVFRFRRPKCHYRSGKYSHLLRDDAPTRHAKKPDADKLLRAILDGITGVVIRDDCQVFAAHTCKAWLPDRTDDERAEVTILFPEEGD